MSDAVDPETFGRVFGPLLNADAEPVDPGLGPDDDPTPLGPWKRERFFHRVYDRHGFFHTLELVARKPRTVQFVTHRRGDPDTVSEVFIVPEAIPRLSGALMRVSYGWRPRRENVTDYPEDVSLRELEISAVDERGFQLLDRNAAGKITDSVTIDTNRIPEVLIALEHAHRELGGESPFADHF